MGARGHQTSGRVKTDLRIKRPIAGRNCLAKSLFFKGENERPFDVLLDPLNLRAKLETAITQTTILGGALDALTSAIVLLNHDQKVIFCNASAERLIQRCPEIQVRHNRFCAKRHADTLKLEWLSKRAAGYNGSDPLAGAVSIQRDFGNLPLQVMAVPIPLKYWASQETAVGRATMVVINDLSVRQSVPQEAISAMYDLTPTEARLVLALIRGQSLKQYGDESRVTQNTARTHLKSVFAKTNTSKQSDLVWLMGVLRSP
jgi:DNA-binding CsgD family transcriptional regulator